MEQSHSEKTKRIAKGLVNVIVGNNERNVIIKR